MSEDLRDIIPDEVQLRDKKETLRNIEQEKHENVKMRDQATVGFIQSSTPQILQIPEIHLTSPKGLTTNLNSEMQNVNMEENDINYEIESEASSEEDDDEDFQDSELPVVMSDPSAPRNESNNLTYHGHGVENKNDNNNINDDDDNDDDADDKKSIPSNLMP